MTTQAEEIGRHRQWKPRTWVLLIASFVIAELIIGNVVMAIVAPPTDPPCAVKPQPPPPPPPAPSKPLEPVDNGSVLPGFYVIGALVSFGIGRWVSGTAGHHGPTLLRDPRGPLLVEADSTGKEVDLYDKTLDKTLEEVKRIQGVRVRTLGPAEELTTPPVPLAVRSAVWVQTCLLVLLTTAVIGLGYEYYGVSNHNNPWPLTYFVRCVNDAASLPTLITTLAVAFVFGMWFWSPTKGDRSPLALAQALPSLLNELASWAGRP